MADSAVRISTGQTDFSGGVDSNVVPTIASDRYPGGLKPNKLAWLENATVRGGGITPRRGIKKLCRFPIQALFQEAIMYQPNSGFPYIISQIGGRTFAVRVDTDNSINEITIPGDPNPPGIDQNWMVQGEQFAVIQDGSSLPLFWDGATLRRSIGPTRVLGVVNNAFVVPAIGQAVDVTLTSPFNGNPGDIVYIGSQKFVVVAYTNFLTVQNDTSPTVGQSYDVDSIINTFPGGTLIASTVAPFTAPPTASTVVVATDTAFGGAVPFVASVNGSGGDWQVTAVGLPALPANHIYLVSIDSNPGTNVAVGTNLYSDAELPAAEAMSYYMGRIWMANGREYVAGDIVGGPSGTPQYNSTDAILHFTENTFLSLGGTFIVPTSAGNIRALAFAINLDTSLGQGQLLALTRSQIYSVNVVPDRAAWAALSEPIQRVAQVNFGTTSDRSVTPVNGDLFFQSTDGVRSFTQALRYFQQWGNVSISSEEDRIVALNDRSLLRFGSGIEFDNRLLQTCLPYQTDLGVCHRGIMPLDFDLISTLEEKAPPAWEGVLEGVAFMRLLKGDFGGLQRAFSIVRSVDGFLEVWELTSQDIDDTNGDDTNRVDWVIETPSYTWDSLFKLKQLDTIELWIDKLYGTVEFTVSFRPDQHGCWEYWHHWEVCTAKNECELPLAPTPCNYPQQVYRQQYKATMVLPKAPQYCGTGNPSVPRPLNIGYSFQFRIEIKGFCRLRGIVAHAFERDKQPYLGITC